MARLSADRLRELFTYDPKTGVLTRRVTLCGRALAGAAAGSRHYEGYLLVMVDGEHHSVHRLAWFYMTGQWPAHQIDHINGDPGDNRFANLRDVSGSMNCQNRRKPNARNRSGLLGVETFQGKFKTSLKVAGSKRHLGTFSTPEAAHAAYLAAKRALHAGCAF